MRDPETGQPHTARTVGPVPLVYVGARAATRCAGGARATSPDPARPARPAAAGGDDRPEPVAARVMRSRPLLLACCLLVAVSVAAAQERDDADAG